MLLHQRVKVGAVSYLYGEIALRGAKGDHKPVGHSYNFRIRGKRATAEAVGVKLPVLAQAAALGPLVSEYVRYGVKSQGEAKIAPTRRNHARDCGSHLGAQSNFAPAAVDEGISLVFYYLLIFHALGLIKFGRLQDGGVVLHVSDFLDKAPARLAEKIQERVILRIEIAHSFVGLCG